MVYCVADNTGGYKLYDVFGKNYNSILDILILEGYNKKIKIITNQHLLKSFFPLFIKSENKSFLKEDYLNMMIKLFWRYKEFWRSIFPILLKKRIIRLTKNA